jgi:hypothetical protein
LLTLNNIFCKLENTWQNCTFITTRVYSLMYCCLFVWWCLTPLSIIFQLYRGGQFYWCRNLGPEENHRLVASHWQTLSHNVVHLTLIEIRTHNLSGDRHWLHTITAATAAETNDLFLNKWKLPGESKNTSVNNSMYASHSASLFTILIVLKIIRNMAWILIAVYQCHTN